MNSKNRRALKFAERESWMSLKDERDIMEKLHSKESEGRKFIIKPDMELTKLADTDCIMTPTTDLRWRRQ